MSIVVKVAISDGFLTAFANLPKQVQKKTTEFINKFRNDPTSSGINYEKVNQAVGDNIFSVRIDNTYRGIIAKQDSPAVYALLWIDHHDEAYAWARKRRCDVNGTTGILQVYSVEEIAEEKNVKAANIRTELLFSSISDKDLLYMGVPEVLLNFVRTLVTHEDFYATKDILPKDAYEGLSWIVEGIPLPEVMDFIAEERKDQESSKDMSDALDMPSTKKSFVVIEGEDDLRKIMAEPLEKWRIFLHPTQRAIVNKDFNGPARVLGGAGTGKTVVAMHRAKQLAAKAAVNEKILFTTFTANLASDIKENLRKICTIPEMRKIEVVNLDAWVSRYLKESGFEARIIYEETLEKIWDEAIAMAGPVDGFPKSFYQDEWTRVVIAQEALSLEKYVKASRKGRGTRLDRRKRMEIWKVFETFYNLMREERVRDVNTAMYECTKLLSQNAGRPQYASIIVDEGQDLSNNAYRLIRAIAGEERKNDIFIVGDSHQRIYKNKPALSQAGVNVRGRSSILKINYRTTEEIRKYAFAILNGISFDDLDEDIDVGDMCQSLTHGERPIVKTFDDGNAELDYIVDEIKKLNEHGVAPNDICIVARTKKLVEEYIDDLDECGIRTFKIERNKTENRGIEGVRIATMHRVKGLEFQYVFAVAVNDRIVPLKKAIDYTDKISEHETMTSEKCLLYVALTRAQKGAYITSYGKQSEFI